MTDQLSTTTQDKPQEAADANPLDRPGVPQELEPEPQADAHWLVPEQQTSEPEIPTRPDNLWAPVDESRDFGAHGRFDGIARGRSWEAGLSRHRSTVAAATMGVAALTALAWATARNRRRRTGGSR